MKILFLAHRVPYPPDKGDKIRSFHELEFLARRHDVYLAALADRVQDLDHRARLATYCRQVILEPISPRRARLRTALRLPVPRPLTLAYFSNAALARQVQRLVAAERLDCAFVFSSSMAQYVERLDIPRVIVDFVDVDSQKWRDYARICRGLPRWIYAVESRRLRRYEQHLARRIACAVFCSRQEQEVFRTFADGSPTAVISNGVDCDVFRPDGRDYDPHRLVFCGAMDYYANVDGVLYFHRQIWPLVKARVPQARWTIAGRDPVRAVRRLAAPDIEVTGFVPDIRPYVQAASVSIAPLRVARGIQNKILESMAMGTPVVASSAAVEGLEVRWPDQVRVADDPRAFAEAVVQIMTSPAERQRLAAAARQRVVDAYTWPKRLEALQALLDESPTKGLNS